MQGKNAIEGEGNKKRSSSSENADLKFRPKKKMSKFDSLKPISN